MYQSVPFIVMLLIYGGMILLVIWGAQTEWKKYMARKNHYQSLKSKAFDTLIKLDDLYTVSTRGTPIYGCNYVGFNDKTQVMEAYNLHTTTDYESDIVTEDFKVNYLDFKDVEVLEDGIILASYSRDVEFTLPEDGYKDEAYKKQKVRLLQVKFYLDDIDNTVHTLTLISVEMRRYMKKYEDRRENAYEIFCVCDDLLSQKYKKR